MGLRGCRGLEEGTRGYNGLQEVKRGYRGLQGFQEVTGVTRGYMK